MTCSRKKKLHLRMSDRINERERERERERSAREREIELRDRDSGKGLGGAAALMAGGTAALYLIRYRRHCRLHAQGIGLESLLHAVLAQAGVTCVY